MPTVSREFFVDHVQPVYNNIVTLKHEIEKKHRYCENEREKEIWAQGYTKIDTLANRFHKDASEGLYSVAQLAVLRQNTSLDWYNAVSWTPPKARLPKVLELKKHKHWQVVRHLFRDSSFSRENAKELAELHNRTKGKTDDGTEEVRSLIQELRNRRKQGGITANYEFKRGPYVKNFSVSDKEILGHYGTVTPSDNTSDDLISLVQVFKQNLKEFRRVISHDRMTLKKTIPNSNRYGLYKVCGVYTQPESILNFKRSLGRKAIKEQKFPLTKESHVGVELEFCSAYNGEYLTNALYKANLAHYCTLKTDGSLRVSKETHYSHELCIVVPESESQNVLKLICKLLISNGCYVNKSCGTHVHLDMRNRNASDCYERLVKSVNVLFAITPPSRREPASGTNYCKKNPQGPEFDEMLDSSDRYWAINACSYKKHKTIEVRLHAGTLSPKKINYWIELLQAIIVTPNDVVFKKIESLAKACNLRRALTEYMLERAALFDQEGVDEDKEHIQEITNTRQAREETTLPMSQNSHACTCSSCMAVRRVPGGGPSRGELIDTTHIYTHDWVDAA